MAMTKKEKAEVEELRYRLATIAALRWTDQVLPDVAIPSDYKTLSKGYLHCGSTSDWPRIEPACSSSIYHGIGQQDKTTSQNPMKLYSTKILALKALRHDVELYSAKKLARIDQMIENELTSK